MGLRTGLLLTLAVIIAVLAPGLIRDGRKLLDDKLNISTTSDPGVTSPTAQAPTETQPAETVAAPPKTVQAPANPPPQETAAVPTAAVPDANPLPVKIVVQWPEPDIERFRAALAFYRAGHMSEGDTVAAQITDPATRDTLEWIMIRTTGLRVDNARIEAFSRRNPDWPSASSLQRLLEAQYLHGRPANDSVLAFFSKREPITIAGKLTLSRALMQTGRKDEAMVMARRLWHTEALSAASRRTLLDTHGAELTKADHRIRLRNLMLNEVWEAANDTAQRVGRDESSLIDAFSAVTAKSRNAGKLLEAVPAPLRTSPEWLLAKSRFERRAGNLKAASEALVKAAAKVGQKPNTTQPTASGIILIEPASAYTSNDTLSVGDAPALAVLTAPIPATSVAKENNDTGSTHWALEQRLVARALLDEGNTKAAYKIAALPFASRESDRIDAAFFAGWIALRFLDNPEKAAQHFAEATPYATLPISIARVAYWRGRAAEGLNNKDAANTFFTQAAKHSTTYYGQLARAKLGLADVAVRPLPEPSQQARKDLSEMRPAQAVRLLFKANEADLTLPLLSGLASQLDDDHLAALAEVVEESQDARAALAMGKAAGYLGKPFDVTAFPTFGIPAIDSDAIEQPMIFAITRQESAFDGKAVSHAGARGLMQLMPATAQATARAAGLPYDLTRLTSDPAYNAQLGASHLGELVERWKGSYILAIASYNAGPGNVRKWIDAYGDPRSDDIDVIDWVERIPFTETRNYVQRVMENLQVYRHRLNKETALLIEQDMGRGRKTPQ
ncbi:transglycosylase SLT domain-containing protein [Pseudochelatococcus sp. G4_1912]|uniref:lytic transglycosylase domain-containing protein n=1 Tax=Pseudochelatococcus sp. G4_1912 TaxID=3114288 RepID=UPI0039C72152